MSSTKPRKQKRIEMKFQLDAQLAEQVRDWARDHLGVDANCNSDTGDSYDISTLYLDTSDWDLFHRTGRIGSAKHRIRRYGDEQTLWLETKRKKKMVVKKSRTAVFESDYLSRCAVQASDQWCGNWFLDRVADRQLQPAIQISYRRFARVAERNGECMRLTIDSDLHAGSVCGWQVGRPSSKQMSTTFGQHQILELKFDNSMPLLFKQLLQTFAIPSTAFSKYRTAVEAHELRELAHA